jgi:hypothetical protein
MEWLIIAMLTVVLAICSVAYVQFLRTRRRLERAIVELEQCIKAANERKTTQRTV